MKSVSCLACPNNNCLIQRFGSTKMMAEIDKIKAQNWYKKGHYIITEGSPVTGLYFIYKGKVKVVSEGFMGKEHIVRLANNGHVIGHRGYGGEIYPVGTVAIDETVACFIDNEAINEAFIEYPKFAVALMMFYSQELRRTEKRIKYLSQMTVRDKIAEAILYLIDIFGIQKDTNIIDVKLSREEISNLAGTNADQVSRAISELCKEGILGTEKKNITILDYEKLKEIVKAYDLYFIYV